MDCDNICIIQFVENIGSLIDNEYDEANKRGIEIEVEWETQHKKMLE